MPLSMEFSFITVTPQYGPVAARDINTLWIEQTIPIAGGTRIVSAYGRIIDVQQTRAQLAALFTAAGLAINLVTVHPTNKTFDLCDINAAWIESVIALPGNAARIGVTSGEDFDVTESRADLAAALGI